MTEHTIIEDGIFTTITAAQAFYLVHLKAIYECPDCETTEGGKIYHVSPGFEEDYVDNTGPFARL
jgi:hypothetical protein